MDELLDYVNDKDEVIGQMLRSEIYARDLYNFRVVNAFIMNDDHKIWVPRRSPSKELFPNCLDASVGGHVQSGESYYEAFVRETFEEVGLDVAKTPHREIKKLVPANDHVSCFSMLYLLFSNEIPLPNSDDFSCSEWMTPQELLNKLHAGTPAKDDLKYLVLAFLQTQQIEPLKS